jgi:hypothetical protein
MVLIVAVMSLAMLPSVAAAQTGASIQVNPSPAQAGELVTVSGQGFQLGEVVSVDFAGSTIGVGVADVNGRFSTSGRVDSSVPAGVHPFDANGDMGSWATFDLTILQAAAPAANPQGWFADPVPAGGSTLVSGSGFMPGERISINFGGSRVGIATANQTGTWSSTVMVPSHMPIGSHPLDVDANMGSSVTKQLTVSAAAPAPTTAPGAVPVATTAPSTPATPTAAPVAAQTSSPKAAAVTPGTLLTTTPVASSSATATVKTQAGVAGSTTPQQTETQERRWIRLPDHDDATSVAKATALAKTEPGHRCLHQPIGFIQHLAGHCTLEDRAVRHVGRDPCSNDHHRRPPFQDRSRRLTHRTLPFPETSTEVAPCDRSISIEGRLFGFSEPCCGWCQGVRS